MYGPAQVGTGHEAAQPDLLVVVDVVLIDQGQVDARVGNREVVQPDVVTMGAFLRSGLVVAGVGAGQPELLGRIAA